MLQNNWRTMDWNKRPFNFAIFYPSKSWTFRDKINHQIYKKNVQLMDCEHLEKYDMDPAVVAWCAYSSLSHSVDCGAGYTVGLNPLGIISIVLE